MSLPILDSLGSIFAIIITVLIGALAVVTKMLGRRGEKLRDVQDQLDAVAEHMSRQKALQERIDKAAQESRQREDAAIQKAREGRRDHFENQP